MNVQLTLDNPAYLGRNAIFRFPQDVGDYHITVILDVLNKTVSGIDTEDESSLDALGLTAIVDTANVIWFDKDAEIQADVDGVLHVVISDVIVEHRDTEEEEDIDQDTSSQMVFLPHEEIEEVDEDDEILAATATEELETTRYRIDSRRNEIESDLKVELVGKKLDLEFTAGILARWELV